MNREVASRERPEKEVSPMGTEDIVETFGFARGVAEVC